MALFCANCHRTAHHQLTRLLLPEDCQLLMARADETAGEKSFTISLFAIRLKRGEFMAYAPSSVGSMAINQDLVFRRRKNWQQPVEIAATALAGRHFGKLIRGPAGDGA